MNRALRFGAWAVAWTFTFLGFAVVLGWWLTLRASNDAAWLPDAT